MFDIHACKVLFNFVDNLDLCESLAEVDRKKFAALIYVGQNESKSSSMKKLSSCSIFGVEVGLIKN